MKLKKIPQLLSLVLMISCSSSKQGRVIQGENGKIKSAVINAKCTPPQKSYAKDLTVKVKAEIDSLRFVPTAVFESAFEQKVVKLRDYSSQGLDIELMMFHICEMANNRGLTSEQTTSLIEKAISIYNKPATINQTVTSYNQQGGITTGILIVPEDKEIPLNDNYVIQNVVLNGKPAIKVHPKQGTWINPYIGYPLNEDSTVKGEVTNLMGFQMSGIGTYGVTGLDVIFKVEDIQFNSTPNAAIYLFYKELPSIIIFGDKANNEKRYKVSVSKIKIR